MRGKKSSIDFAKIKQCIAVEGHSNCSLQLICSEFNISDKAPLKKIIAQLILIFYPASKVFGDEKHTLLKLEKAANKILSAFATHHLVNDDDMEGEYLLAEHGHNIGFAIEKHIQQNKSAEPVAGAYEHELNYIHLAQYLSNKYGVLTEEACTKIDGFMDCLAALRDMAEEEKKQGRPSKGMIESAVFEIAHYWSNVLGRDFSYTFTKDTKHQPLSDAGIFVYCMFLLVMGSKAENEFKASLETSMRKARDLLDRKAEDFKQGLRENK